MSIIWIDRILKLFGKPLVDAHRLLKNSIGLDTYILITIEYLKELRVVGLEAELVDGYKNANFTILEICVARINIPKRNRHLRNIRLLFNKTYVMKEICTRRYG